ncbi:MAG: ATP-binding protein [Roseburia sp.]
MIEWNIEAKTEHLDEVLGLISRHLQQRNCPIKIQMQIEVAVEEIFVNIAQYAYDRENGMVTIRVEDQEAPPAVVITFLDQGTPYNPLEKEDPDVTLSAEERQIGGLGIFLVKKTMDQVDYRYENGQNRLSIRKVFS